MANPGEMHHVVLDAGDLERSDAFYGGLLGLTPLGRGVWPEDSPNTAFRADSGQYIVLVQGPGARPDGPEEHLQLFLALNSWHAVHDRLERLGYALRDERKAGLRAVGELAMHVRDPDGHLLELNAHEPRAYEVPPARRGKVVAGRIEDFPIGSVTRIPRAQCYLVRLAGGFLALSQVCTHMQFTVTYQPEHYRFFCPRHRYRFGRTGACLPRPGRSNAPPLHIYAVEFIDGLIVVDTDTSTARAEDEADRLVPAPQSVPAASTTDGVG